jgi:hypothetical protein
MIITHESPVGAKGVRQRVRKERAVDQPRTKSSLSHRRRKLLEIMQNLNYGRIEDLSIERGEPVFDGASTFKEIKLGSENYPRPELHQSDFVLRNEVLELFRYLDELGNGRIPLIQVRSGLPCRVVIRQDDIAQRGQQTSEDSNA